jgi:class 3 adenylate cyclase
VVDEVQIGVEIQEVIRAKNAELPDERRIEFRIGINLGDANQEGKRIYDDGFNIAARVEGLADPGGICISGSGYEQIENKLALGYDYIGEHTVRNIVKPIRVYRVTTGPVTLQKVTEEKKPAPSWQLQLLKW